MPAAAKAAAEKGVDAGIVLRVAGPGGRVLKEDIAKCEVPSTCCCESSSCG